MIKVRATKYSGLYLLEAKGHARADVCCGAGMIMQAAILGLRDLAKQFPKQISFEGFQGEAFTDTVDSTDRRKKRR